MTPVEPPSTDATQDGEGLPAPPPDHRGAPLLPILEYPDPRLREVAAPVERFDDELRATVASLLATLYATGGLALAAPQVGVARRLVVMDLSEEKNAPQVFINPEFLLVSGPQALVEESCLSVPGVSEVVRRRLGIDVRARDVEGRTFEVEASGLLAVCLQHEADHLAGKLFIDHLPWLKRFRVKRQLTRAQAGKGRSVPSGSG